MLENPAVLDDLLLQEIGFLENTVNGKSLGECFLVFKSVGSCNAAYEILKTKYDVDFSKLIDNPYLTKHALDRARSPKLKYTRSSSRDRDRSKSPQRSFKRYDDRPNRDTRSKSPQRRYGDRHEKRYDDRSKYRNYDRKYDDYDRNRGNERLFYDDKYREKRKSQSSRDLPKEESMPTKRSRKSTATDSDDTDLLSPNWRD